MQIHHRPHWGDAFFAFNGKTLYTIIVPLEGKVASKLREALIQVLKPIKNRVHTLTYDNGKEFAEHEEMAKALDAEIYFAHYRFRANAPFMLARSKSLD